MGKGTALITGASSGIGRALARRLAAEQHDLVLVGRDSAVLQNLAQELAHTHRISALALTQDLRDAEAARTLCDELTRRGIEVDILVNNAGFGVHGAFASTNLADELDLVHVQLDAMLGLTKFLVAPMRARRAGKILNVASVYSFAPVPGQAVYAACKAFMLSFSDTLAYETQDDGITVTVLCPGSTRTAFRSRAGVKEKNPRGSGMSAEVVADCGYHGMMRGQRLVIPGFWNTVFVVLTSLLPGNWNARLLAVINRKRLATH